jgi:hypothetical protein
MSLPVPLSRLQRGVAAFALIAPVFVATLPAHAAVITADDILGQFNAVVTNNFSTNSDVAGRRQYQQQREFRRSTRTPIPRVRRHRFRALTP